MVELGIYEMKNKRNDVLVINVLKYMCMNALLDFRYQAKAKSFFPVKSEDREELVIYFPFAPPIVGLYLC